MDAPSPALLNFQRMIAAGKEGPLIRFALGNELLKAGDPAAAVEHLAKAVVLDAQYTAAWKLYGKALVEAGRNEEALAAYRQGIAVAQKKGDRQAEKEMLVFARRIERTNPDESA